MAKDISGLRRGGPGRPKGIPNKMSQNAREAFQMAFDKLGGADALAEWARSNQTDFYRLYARMIPVQVASGEGNQPLPLHITLTTDAATPSHAE